MFAQTALLTLKKAPAPSEQEPRSETEVDEEEEVEPPPKTTRPKPKPTRKNAPSDDESVPAKKVVSSRPAKESRREDTGVEEQPEKSEKAKGKRKAREPSDDEAEEERPTSKGRHKADSGRAVSAQAVPRSRGSVRSASAAIEPSKAKRVKSASKQAPILPEATDEVEDDTIPKKKKRKINIFPPSQPTSFPWGQLPQVRDC